MKIKKIAAAVAAAAVLASAPITGALPDVMSVTASAAEEKLITFPCPEEFAGLTRISLGNGNYVYGDYDSWQRFFRSILEKGLIHIGEAEIEEWRKTGKLEYKTAEFDSKINVGKFEYVKDDTLYYEYQTKTGENRYDVVKFNESGDKVVKVGDLSRDEFDSVYYSRKEERSDGYSFSADFYPQSDDNGKRTFTYKIKSPDGKEIEKTLSYTPNGEEGLVYQGDSCAALAGKYVGFITWKTSQEAGKCKYDIYGINKDGSRDTIATMVREALENNVTWSSNSSAEFYYWIDLESDSIYVYTFDDDKIHELKGIKEGNDSAFCYINGIYGSKAVVQVGSEMLVGGATYRIFDLNEGKSLTSTYASLVSQDNGETFLATKSDNGKYCYLDSNCKELAEFDYAVSFKSDDVYVPVVKDGKGWLIDKNMNQVSEKIDAAKCSVMGDGLFEFEVINEQGQSTKVWATTADKDSGGQTTPTKPVAKPVEYADDTTGIKASANEGVIAAGAEFTAEPVAEETKDGDFVYEMKFVKDGKDVQPNGAVTVTLPVPEEFKDKTVHVYREEENGSFTKMNSKVEGGLVSFTTNHFSKYLVTSRVIEGASEENPDTGIPGISLAMAAIAAAGAGLIVVGKKRK